MSLYVSPGSSENGGTPKAIKPKTYINEKNATANKSARGAGTAKWAEIQDAVNSSLSDEELKRDYQADRPQLRSWLKDNPPSTMFKMPV